MPDRKTAIIRAAERMVAQASATQQVGVVWAGLDETQGAFSIRSAAMRRGRAGRILAAVPHGFDVPTGVEPVPFAPKMFSLLHPDAKSRYRVGSGGRGSGKSHGFATAVVLYCLAAKRRVLCCREIMRSLRESVHHLIVSKIDELRLTGFFDVTDREITCKLTGAEVIFSGLWSNLSALKSLEGVSLTWIEEAESVSAESLAVLAPTIREPNSEIWMSANPDSPNAPIQGYIEGQRADVRHVHVVYSDNCWFPSVLETERAYLERVDQDSYRHIWLGMTRVNSDALIFKAKYVIEDFKPLPIWNGPYHGLDLGFASDPSVLTRCWVADDRLYIEAEAWGLHVDIHKLPQLLDQIPEARPHAIRVDNSRPETVSYLKQHGFPNAESVDKWPDSVKDGIARMRAFEKIVIHPSCVHTIDEFGSYRFKVDRLTGDVMPEVVDKNNHAIDSIRYAIAPLIKGGGPNSLVAYYASLTVQDNQTQTKLLDRPGVVVTDIQSPWHRP